MLIHCIGSVEEITFDVVFNLFKMISIRITLKPPHKYSVVCPNWKAVSVLLSPNIELSQIFVQILWESSCMKMIENYFIHMRYNPCLFKSVNGEHMFCARFYWLAQLLQSCIFFWTEWKIFTPRKVLENASNQFEPMKMNCVGILEHCCVIKGMSCATNC